MKVVIIQGIFNRYREAFYDALLARMKDRNIELTLYYGRTKERASYAVFASLANYGTALSAERFSER